MGDRKRRLGRGRYDIYQCVSSGLTHGGGRELSSYSNNGDDTVMPHYFVEHYVCDAKDCEEEVVREHMQGAEIPDMLPKDWVMIDDQGSYHRFSSRYFCPLHPISVSVAIEDYIHTHNWNDWGGQDSKDESHMCVCGHESSKHESMARQNLTPCDDCPCTKWREPVDMLKESAGFKSRIWDQYE